MKSLFITILLFATLQLNAQSLKNIFSKTIGSSTNTIMSSSSSSSALLGGDEISNALKEALQKGVERGTTKLSATDGFFKDAAIKILLPPEAQKAGEKLRALGFEKQVDDAILSMNRAAEDAAKTAAPIFVNAIKQMSITDAVGLLKGGDSAATKYLREKTTIQLSNAFKPVIEQSMAKTEATKYWNTFTTSYNKIPFVKKINTDLAAYVTEKALSGIFYQLALEEQKIRKDPVARTTDLLKKVFGN
ncbi:MAG: DUF4197 domain-containing protein [Bacteroidetes bacterium]|nr:DUF4197 domain-containing protein [Bacteroidota bacterium]MBS1648238.1 DUF4197 domain-containing protein [Bacteroidota bacterium]